MSVTSEEIQFRLSGGSTNGSPLLSLGGAKSEASASLQLFDNVSSDGADLGLTDFRCIYIHNGNSSLDLIGATAWLASNTPSSTTDISIGVGTSGPNGTEPPVATAHSAPAGVSFSSPFSKTTGILLGDIPAGESRALWLRRIVNPGTSASRSDPFTLSVEGNTL